VAFVTSHITSGDFRQGGSSPIFIVPCLFALIFLAVFCIYSLGAFTLFLAFSNI
jgi:hypothetical protein